MTAPKEKNLSYAIIILGTCLAHRDFAEHFRIFKAKSNMHSESDTQIKVR